jgi:DNA repair protein RadC
VPTIETLRVIHLSSDRDILDIRLYNGTHRAVVVPVRQIVADALRLGSRAVILSHNHPSGNPTPSRADIAVTKQLAMLLAALDVRLHDHIIVSDGRSVSFRRTGLL